MQDMAKMKDTGRFSGMSADFMLISVKCRALAVVMAATVFAAPAAAQAPGQAPGQAVVPAITVTGEGRVEAAPDIALIRLGAVERADSPAEAMERAGAAARGILQRMEAAGIAQRDLQTSELMLAPVWSHDRETGQSRPDGFEARIEISVRVRELAGLGSVLDAALAVGANRFGGLQFALSDPAALHDEARRLAVADALARAQLYAEAAGVPLGPVTRIAEAGVARPPQPPMLRSAEMAADAGVPVAEGTLEVTAQVTVHFGPPG